MKTIITFVLFLFLYLIASGCETDESKTCIDMLRNTTCKCSNIQILEPKENQEFNVDKINVSGIAKLSNDCSRVLLITYKYIDQKYYYQSFRSINFNNPTENDYEFDFEIYLQSSGFSSEEIDQKYKYESIIVFISSFEDVTYIPGYSNSAKGVSEEEILCFSSLSFGVSKSDEITIKNLLPSTK